MCFNIFNRGEQNTNKEGLEAEYEGLTGNLTLTLPFGVEHPTTGKHDGIDFYSSDLIFKYPFYRGRVLYVGHEPSGLGKYVVFRWVSESKQTKIVLAAHFEEIYVKVNDLVFKGHKIGKMGKTGYSTGIHCHLSVFKPIDPMPLMKG